MVSLAVIVAVAPPPHPSASQVKAEIISAMQSAGIAPPYRFTLPRAVGGDRSVDLDSFDGIGVLPLRDMPPTREEMLADLSIVLRFNDSHEAP